MPGTSIGGKKATSTRLKRDPHAFEKMARRRHDKTPEEETEIARKAARTRLARDPDAFRKMSALQKQKALKNKTSNF